MAQIRVGIIGYGNIGRGVAQAVRMNGDMALVGIFSRRQQLELAPLDEGTPVYPVEHILNYQDQVDVMILCGGSATDLPIQGPQYARQFHLVDSFDTHAKIPEYFAAVDAAAKEGGKLALISGGWDPGLFSLLRVLSGAALPSGQHYTFWGDGVSQGHSDALRRIPGVQYAIQYTRPYPEALDAVRSSKNPVLSTREMHYRECFVVPEDGADTAAIEKTIVTMPNYFADYNTTVHFVTMEDIQRDHSAMPHGGFVFRSGETSKGNQSIIEFSLNLDSNPEFTASILVAYARAVYRMAQDGRTGAITAFDVAPGLLHPLSPEELRRTLL